LLVMAVLALGGVCSAQEAAGPGPVRSLLGPLTNLSSGGRFPDRPVDADDDYFVVPRAFGARRETEPPRYVRGLDEVDWLGREEASWLDLGLDYRARYDLRHNDFRRPELGINDPFLLRTRAYLGVKEILDPFRFAAEFEDARRYNSLEPIDGRDVNQHELIQLFGELYFEEPLGIDKTLRLQAGRLAFEYTDRRLISRADWRNTTNNFQGVRGTLGEEPDNWQLDVLAVQPMERNPSGLDQADPGTLFFGVVGDWRQWSHIVTWQPYYLLYQQDDRDGRADREIHTVALRGYGVNAETNIDYDLDVALQFGRDDGRQHRAFALHTDVGYTFDTPTTPRVSAGFGYASGDRDPNDNRSNRFDRLYGFGRPWSINDYFNWDNLITPRVRFSCQINEHANLEASYSAFWLASATDSWLLADLQDPTGQSGTFLGHELEAHFRWSATKRTDIIVGYAYFAPGEFPKNLGRNQASNYLYVQTLVRLFE